MEHSYTPALTRKELTRSLGILGLGLALLGSISAQAQVIKVEAESGVLAGTAALDNAYTAPSGTGYVKFDQTGSLTLTVPVTATQGAGAYDMIIRYASEFDFKLVDLRVNGAATDPRQTRYLNKTGTATGVTFRSTTNSRYNLTAGNNTVVFTATYGYHAIDYVQFTKAAASPVLLTPSATGRIEAEAGVVSGAQAYLRDGGAGQSGSLYVGNFVTPTDNVTFNVNVATAGQYRVVVGARQEFNDKAYTIAVNGGTAASVNIPNTLTGTAVTAPFGPTQGGSFAMTAGANTVVIGGQGGYFDIDYIELIATTASAARAGINGLSAIAAYPNPATDDNLSVSLQATAKQTVQVALVNALGQRVRTAARTLQVGQNQFPVSTDGLANGVYQLVVYVNNQASAVHRVVLAR